MFPVVRAEAIVDAVCRGRRHLTVPLWYRALFLWRMLAPEVGDFTQRVFYRRTAGGSHGDQQAKARRFLEATGAKGGAPAGVAAELRYQAGIDQDDTARTQLI